MSAYPVENIPYGLSVNYKSKLYSVLRGIKTNWSAGIKTPTTLERRGNLKVLLAIGIGFTIVAPYPNLACGIVGDMKG